jgi:hypothetical protein
MRVASTIPLCNPISLSLEWLAHTVGRRDPIAVDKLDGVADYNHVKAYSLALGFDLP